MASGSVVVFLGLGPGLAFFVGSIAFVLFDEAEDEADGPTPVVDVA